MVLATYLHPGVESHRIETSPATGLRKLSPTL